MTSLPQFSVTSAVTVKVVDNVFRGISSTLQLDGAFKIEAHVGGICSGRLVQQGSGFLTVHGALCGRQASVCQNTTTRHREEASESQNLSSTCCTYSTCTVRVLPQHLSALLLLSGKQGCAAQIPSNCTGP